MAAYFAVALSAFVWLCFCIDRVPITGDGRTYVAGIQALYDNFWAPRHESLNTGAEFSFAFTPYLRAFAAVGSLCGWSAYRAFQFAGICNVALLFVAIPLFAFASRPQVHDDDNGAARATREPWLVAVVLLAACLLLRDRNALWSSEISLRSLPAVWGYPSTHAWGLVLLLLATVAAAMRQMRAWHPIAIGLLLCALLLDHPLTASWGFGIAGVFALAGLGAARSRRALLPAIAIVAALLIGIAAATLWPHASFLNAAITGAAANDTTKGEPWAFVSTPLFLAAPAALFLLVQRRGAAVLAASFATWAVMVASSSLGLSYGVRYIYFFLFCLHWLIAEALSALASGSDASAVRRGVAVVTIAAFGVLLYLGPIVQGSDHVRGALPTWAELSAKKPAAEQFYRQLGPLADQLHDDDVVLTNDLKLGLVLAPLTGARSVYARFAVHLPDAAERERDLGKFFRRSTAATTRQAIVARWGVTRVIAADRSPEVLASLEAHFGKPLARFGKYVLYDARIVASDAAAGVVVDDAVENVQADDDTDGAE